MKHNSSVLLELEQSIDDIESYLQSKPAELDNDQADLERSLEDLEKHLNPELKKQNKIHERSTKTLNRIDRALRESKEKESITIKQNLDIELSDFEDTDISYIDFR